MIHSANEVIRQQLHAPMKSSETVTPQPQATPLDEKPIPCDSSDIIKNLRNRNCDLATAIYLLQKKNKESEALVKNDDPKPSQKAELQPEQNTGEPDLEEIYFPSPPQVSFEGLDTASPDESIQISQLDNTEKNSSDTEVLSQDEKMDESSAEEEVLFSDNDEANNELVSIGHGVDIKAKFLNKCLIYGKTAKRLTRCLVDVLFPDLKLLSTCSAFGQKSNVTKLTRAALPSKKVAAILDFVQKRFPSATRTEIVLAINLKCKEARHIVEKQTGEKPLKTNLFRRLLAKDQNLEESKISSSPTSTTTSVSTSSNVTNTKTPGAKVTVMRQPVNQRICVKPPPSTTPNATENTTPHTKLVTAANILRCSPQVLLRPKFSQAGESTSVALQPRLARQTVRSLLTHSQNVIKAPMNEGNKILVPLEALKQSVTVSSANSSINSSKPFTRIIIGSPVTTTAQTLSVTQPSSLPSNIRK